MAHAVNVLSPAAAVPLPVVAEILDVLQHVMYAAKNPSVLYHTGVWLKSLKEQHTK